MYVFKLHALSVVNNEYRERSRSYIQQQNCYKSGTCMLYVDQTLALYTSDQRDHSS